ncbi:MAG: hypothetical protein IPG99_08010 [Ignavibacteria bacterium]|nr:hypothetical protein [Ignavibacteria bacterium]
MYTATLYSAGSTPFNLPCKNPYEPIGGTDVYSSPGGDDNIYGSHFSQSKPVMINNMEWQM